MASHLEDLDAFEARGGGRSFAGLLERRGRDRGVDRPEDEVAEDPDVPLRAAAIHLGDRPSGRQGLAMSTTRKPPFQVPW